MGLRKILLSVLILSAYITYSQSVSEPQKRKVLKQMGISPGFNYHLQISQLDIAPIIAIQSKRRIQPGIGLNYLYYYREPRKGKSSYGFNLFSRYFITKFIFAHGEYLYCDVPYLKQLNHEYSRVKKADFFIGAGYRQPIGDRVNSYLSIMVNINHTTESAYKNLIVFKAGILF